MWPIDHNSAGYLTESIASYADTRLQLAFNVSRSLKKKHDIRFYGLEKKKTAHGITIRGKMPGTLFAIRDFLFVR